ncbi:MAG: UrcA family protein [Candidatus Sphingomonas colombiensis]|nr:UrcA family protein [Sphingomonas sp.]WEK43105.1 MAG: UrcA family protein [Sphingomonas sp.]
MKSILTLAAFAAALTGAPAFAQSVDPAPSIAVRHADLNLTNAQDVRRLDHRITHAVIDVCGTASSADPGGQINVTRCRAETMAVASAQRGALIAASQQTQLASATVR